MTLPPNAKKVFEGVLFDVYQWDQKQFDNTLKVFEAVKRKASVQVIAVTKNKKIVLLDEEHPHAGKFLSLPGGICDTDIPEEDAKRELLEETGMECCDLILWKKTSFSAKVMWDNYYFIAKNCVKVTRPALDSGEKIDAFEVNFEEFVEKVLSKDFRNKEFAYFVLKMFHEKGLDDFKKLIL